MATCSNILGIINEEEIVRAAITTSATRTASALHGTICDNIREQLVDTVENQKTKKKIDVRRDLSQDQLQQLNDLYPERHIMTSACERGTHSFAAASRKIETDLLLSAIPKDAWVYDIGGNWATHVKRNDGRNVHCCCPVLDFRDAQRKMKRWMSVEKFKADREAIAPQIGEKIKEIALDETRISGNLKAGRTQPEDLSGKWYCENTFEDCVYRVDKAYAMAIHSIYDIPLSGLVDGLEEKGIRHMTGTFLFSVDMLLGKKRGDLPSVSGFFEVAGEFVKYGFYDDPNCGYKHNLSDLLEYLTKTFVKAKGGSVYYLELTEQRGDVMFFSLTDATEARLHGIGEDSSFKCLPLDAKDSVIFPLFEVDRKTDQLVFTEAIIPRSFLGRAIEYTVRLKTNQLNPETVNSYLSSTNNSIIIGGASKKTVEKVDPALLQQITTTMIVWTELNNCRQKQVLGKLRMQMKDDVDFFSLAKATLLKMFGKVSYFQRALRAYATWINYCYGTDAIKFRNVPLYVEVNDRVKLWQQHAPNFGFSFDIEELDQKIKLYKELEMEKKNISEFVAQEKLGDLYLGGTDAPITAAGSQSRVRSNRRKTTAKDLVGGAIHTNFLDDWVNTHGHWNAVEIHSEKRHPALALLLRGWHLLVPPMQFAPIYVDEGCSDDDSEHDEDLVEKPVSEEKLQSVVSTVEEVTVVETVETPEKPATPCKPVLHLSRYPDDHDDSCVCIVTAVDNNYLLEWSCQKKAVGEVDTVSERPHGKSVIVEQVPLWTEVGVREAALLDCVPRGSGSGSPILMQERENDLVIVREPLLAEALRRNEKTAVIAEPVLPAQVANTVVTVEEVNASPKVSDTAAATVAEAAAEVVVPVAAVAAPVVVAEESSGESGGSSDTTSVSDTPDERSWGERAEMETDDDYHMYQELLNDVVERRPLPPVPDYRKFDTIQKKSKAEYVWYLSAKVTSDRTTLRSVIEDFAAGMFHNGNCDLPKDARFLDYSKSNVGEWVYGKPSRFGHAYGVGFTLNKDGKVGECKLVKLTWEHDKRKRFIEKPFNFMSHPYLLVSDHTFLMNEMTLYKNLYKVITAKKARKNEASIILKDGVPGCGKTTWILNNANYAKDVILSMGKEATEDVKERFAKKYKLVERDLKRIRTVDSYLMHDCGKELRAAKLHFDEALMAHAGMVYFCADLVGARRVICQGDSQQIPFVNRVESITLRYSRLQIDKTERIRLTYRSPVDVAHYLNQKQYYTGGRIATTNPVVRSMKTVGPRCAKPMTSVHSVPYIQGTQYLTFTQMEKDDLAKALKGRGPVSVNTVHEAQGKTFDDVILVRLKSTDNPIYPGGINAQPYTIVSTTRHRRSLVYYTACEDRLHVDILAMQSVMEDKLMKSLYTENEK